jgi:hypothetical protein
MTSLLTHYSEGSTSASQYTSVCHNTILVIWFTNHTLQLQCALDYNNST